MRVPPSGCGGAHVVLMQQLQNAGVIMPGTLRILNLRSLRPVVSVDLNCLACRHGAFCGG